uniref:Putative secreted protein n=1 Tax=Anopheles marajoara TaxID=58244 RepID=A0A2M4C8R6_9DIPT
MPPWHVCLCVCVWWLTDSGMWQYVSLCPWNDEEDGMEGKLVIRLSERNAYECSGVGPKLVCLETNRKVANRTTCAANGDRDLTIERILLCIRLIRLIFRI